MQYSQIIFYLLWGSTNALYWVRMTELGLNIKAAHEMIEQEQEIETGNKLLKEKIKEKNCKKHVGMSNKHFRGFGAGRS